jgi:hypothetical protein
MHCSEIACTVFDAVRDCWMMICAANSSRLARPLAQFDADGNGVLDRQELMSFLQVGGVAERTYLSVLSGVWC